MACRSAVATGVLQPGRPRLRAHPYSAVVLLSALDIRSIVSLALFCVNELHGPYLGACIDIVLRWILAYATGRVRQGALSREPLTIEITAARRQQNHETQPLHSGSIGADRRIVKAIQSYTMKEGYKCPTPHTD